MPKAHIVGSSSNRLLDALEPNSRKRIEPHLRPVSFKLGVTVCEAGGLLRHAYFRRAPSSLC